MFSEHSWGKTNVNIPYHYFYSMINAVIVVATCLINTVVIILLHL